MLSPNPMIPIEEMHEKIRGDLLSAESSKQERALKSLLPAFHRFVKDTVKRGDYAQFKESWEAENERELTKLDYIVNLADIFLEPFLPLDLENPDKHRPLLEKFAGRYMKAHM